VKRRHPPAPGTAWAGVEVGVRPVKAFRPKRTSASGRRHVQLSGLVVNLKGNFVELGAVRPCVVTTEHEVSTAREDDAYICLGAAAVTAVEGGKNRRDWSRCGICTCHAYLQQLVTRFRSELRLALQPHYAC
jgi:hypothetical protein